MGGNFQIPTLYTICFGTSNFARYSILNSGTQILLDSKSQLTHNRINKTERFGTYGWPCNASQKHESTLLHPFKRMYWTIFLQTTVQKHKVSYRSLHFFATFCINEIFFKGTVSLLKCLETVKSLFSTENRVLQSYSNIDNRKKKWVPNFGTQRNDWPFGNALAVSFFRRCAHLCCLTRILFSLQYRKEKR